MKKLKLIVTSSIVSLLFFASSCDFLDVQDHYDELIPYDSVFSNTRNLQKYLWAIPTAFPDEGELLAYTHTPGPLATDEAITAFSAMGTWKGIAFTTGVVTADNLSGLDNWGAMYKIIRRASILLSRMDEARDLTPTDRAEIMSYARFIRAYAYYQLVMNFGPVIILGDDVLGNNESEEYYNRSRATYDECIEYMCTEFEEAAKYMPASVLTSQFGRPTKGAAWALIARLRLQHASPLYNGGEVARRYYGGWTRTEDGAHYISQTYDERRWAVAAAAAKRVIDMGIYKLHTIPNDPLTPVFPSNIPVDDFPNGIGGIDPFKSYSEMFTGETVPQRNVEYIWGNYSVGIALRTRNSFPKDLMGGYNGISVPQKIINNFRMIDGREINEASAEYPYQPDIMNPGTAKEFSGYTLPKNISGMYVNREMRFYATIGFSGRYWTGSSTADANAKNKIVTYDINGNSGFAGKDNDWDYPPTGYVITKYIHPDDNWKGTGATRVSKGFPTIRYAEILLSYVEALNNLTQSHTVILPTATTPETEFIVSRDVNEMKVNFNMVRYRAGLPGLADNELASPERMQELMEKERMIEFLHENRRYFDVRRWGIYEREESQDIMGMNIYAKEPEFYTPVIVNHKYIRERVVHPRLMFLPIPRVETYKSRKIDQNPGWD